MKSAGVKTNPSEQCHHQRFTTEHRAISAFMSCVRQLARCRLGQLRGIRSNSLRGSTSEAWKVMKLALTYFLSVLTESVGAVLVVGKSTVDAHGLVCLSVGFCT